MKISLFQGILLGVFALAGVIGVFSFATFQGGNNPEDEIGSVVIWGAIPKGDFDAALTTIRQSDQRLKGISYIYKQPSTLRTNLVAAIAAGTGPDLVLISHEDLLSLLKVIEPLTSSTLPERTFKDTFAGGAEVFLIPNDGGAYGVPFLIDPLVLFSNRTILNSAGVAKPPVTWEAFTGLVSKVATRNAAGNIDQALIALGTYANVHNARGILSTLFLQAGAALSTAGQGFRRADLGTSRAQGVPPGSEVIRFYTQFADPAKVSYTWNASLPDSRDRFMSGDTALYPGYASEAAYFSEANPNLDFDVASLPQLAIGPTKTTYGQIYGFVIPRGSKNPAGALKAAFGFAGSAANKLAAEAAHMAPANRTVLASPPSESRAAVAYTSALYTRAWLSPAPSDTDTVFSTMITNVTSGRFTIDNALSTAETILSGLLNQ